MAGVVATQGGADRMRAPRKMSMVLKNPYADSSSLPFRFRQKRFAHVRELIDGIIAAKGSCRILDVGGETVYWNIAKDFIDSRNVHITLVNLEAPVVTHPKMASERGDATDLSQYADNSFDLVHSNSVIEHVGDWIAMRKMAANVRRLAPKYYVQTPYFWFPVEPHVRLPFFHWLPEQLRYRILMRFDVGFSKRRSTIDSAMEDIQRMVLLDGRQFAALFPDAEMRSERVLGVTKSLIAIRS